MGFIILLQGCKHSIEIKRANDKYQKEVLSLFNEDYLEHFPKRIEYLPIQYVIDTTNYYDHPRLILISSYPNDVIDTMVNYFSAIALAKYNANQKDLLIVNRFTRKDNWSTKRKASNLKIKHYIEESNFNGKYPIPNFWDIDISANRNECMLPSDFSIVVLEAKAGIFFSQKYHTKGKYMPEGWKNGFSRGVAISKKRGIIVYWLIIW